MFLKAWRKCHKNEMKTILIPICNGAVAKNILRTDVVKTLLSRADVRVVCLMDSPEKAVYYQNEVPHERIIYDSFYKIPDGIGERFFGLLKFHLINTSTIDLWRRMSYDEHESYVRYAASILFNRIIARSSVRKAIRFFDYHCIGDPGFWVVLEKYRPDVVFLSHLFGDAEISLLREAKKRGIKAIGFINSWDKVTGRCSLRLLPDTLIVFNEIVKQEVIAFADMPEKKIIISGIPQYDQFINDMPTPREAFFGKLGLDPDKHLILYSPRGIKFSVSDWAMIDFLHMAISDGKVPSAELFVRFPPNDFLDEAELSMRPWLKYDLPGKRFCTRQNHLVHGSIRSDDWDMNFDELRRLTDTLAHASVVVGYTSSIMIDAAIFDKPIVGVHFEVEQDQPLAGSPTQYYKTDHFTKALSSGGIRLAGSREELVGAINAYLRDPSIDKEERKRLAEEQCWRLDGKAGERVARAVLEILS